MGVPPFDEGASQVIVAEPSIAVAARFDGVVGTEKVVNVDMAQLLNPVAFSALLRKIYSTPFERPEMLAEFTVPVSNRFHKVPVFDSIQSI
tara:strand:- start:369 stop:641 length:273 start_codon:yes stop_codon:yes gene_type:complete